MSNPFNPSLETDVDFVRFLVGDWQGCPQVPDEVIAALLTDAVGSYGTGTWNRYWVAALVLDAMVVQWRAANKGKSSETVSRLSIEYGGTSGHIDELLATKARQYREHAAWLMHPRPRPFAII